MLVWMLIFLREDGTIFLVYEEEKSVKFSSPATLSHVLVIYFLCECPESDSFPLQYKSIHCEEPVSRKK